MRSQSPCYLIIKSFWLQITKSNIMAALTQFLWIAILGGIAGFLYGFLIGANDVANAFASSASSKSVTLKQAVLIASVCEFSGAFFLGASLTGTIRNKIVDIDVYKDEPEILMFGMFTALLSAVIMLWIATHFGLPVSTTHDSRVGCIMGFSIAAKGFDSVQWDNFKKIVVSCVSSPLLSGSVSFVLFGSVKYLVMKSDNAFQRAYYTFPIVLLIGLGINIFYVLYKRAATLVL
jgi:phosphate/sulfate permease